MFYLLNLVLKLATKSYTRPLAAIKMKTEYISIFFKFLDGQLKIQELESWIYSTPGLAYDLEEEFYSELIEFNFKDKYSDGLLVNLITEKIINQGDFLTWKISLKPSHVF